MHKFKNRMEIVAAIVMATMLLFGGVAHAQKSGSLVVPVRVVDGHLVVTGHVANRSGDINDVSLEISFEDPGVFTLDANQYRWLDDPEVVKLFLQPQLQLQFPAAEVKAETRVQRSQMHDDMTKFLSGKLDQPKVKGILGAGFLRKYHVALDVAAGTLTLSPLDAGPARGQIVSSFELRAGRVWVPLDYGAGKSGEMLLGGDVYDTYIDSALARQLGKPAGDVAPVWLGRSGEIDLSRQMALRPYEIKGANSGATVITGVNFLEAFRVDVDWSRSQVAFTPTARPQYPEADFAYFQAEAQASPDALQSYLERFPDARLSREAVQRLMDERLQQQDATDDQFMKALKWVADTSPPGRRMENCAVYVRAFRGMPDRASLVVQSGLFALQYSRDAITVQDIYRLHNIVGEAYLQQDKLNDAWRHFLSAAFMPLDNQTDLAHNVEVNLNLARCYDRMGRTTRAYSRYMHTQGLIELLKEQLAGVDDNAALPPELRQKMNVLKAAMDEVPTAIERLKQEIPADELEMLEG
jgi:hypothetical protein